MKGLIILFQICLEIKLTSGTADEGSGSGFRDSWGFAFLCDDDDTAVAVPSITPRTPEEG